MKKTVRKKAGKLICKITATVLKIVLACFVGVAVLAYLMAIVAIGYAM